MGEIGGGTRRDRGRRDGRGMEKRCIIVLVLVLVL